MVVRTASVAVGMQARSTGASIAAVANIAAVASTGFALRKKAVSLVSR